MEKNIAALLDKKAYTIGVRYQHAMGDAAGNTYTYVTNIPGLRVGDLVVVPTMDREMKRKHVPRTTIIHAQDGEIEGITDVGDDGEMYRSASSRYPGVRWSIAIVTQVDSSVDLEPNDEIEYRWVVERVSFASYDQLMERNSAITGAVAEAYKRNIRRSFAERIIGEMGDDERSMITKLLEN